MELDLEKQKQQFLLQAEITAQYLHSLFTPHPELR